jgi:hypothetical protein
MSVVVSRNARPSICAAAAALWPAATGFVILAGGAPS